MERSNKEVLADDLGVERYPYDAVKDMIAKCSERYEFGIKSYAEGKIKELRQGKNPKREESDRLLSIII